MTAQNSRRPVAAASADNIKVLRPEEAGPQISVRQPRGRPPVSVSMAAMPLDTISGAGRTASREAAVTPASLESCKGRVSPVLSARCGGRASLKSSTPSGSGQTSASFSLAKTKGRLWAAEVENTAEDIISSEKISGNAGARKLRRHFRFLFAFKDCAPRARDCQAVT